MAVLQRTPHSITDQGVTSLKDLYPFEKFDRQVCELDSCPKTGGVLVIEHSQYFFKDSSVADRYDNLRLDQTQRRYSAMFDPDSTLVGNDTGGGGIFTKTRR